jgi:hypothetical protein
LPLGTTDGSSLALLNSDSGALQMVTGIFQAGATPPSPGTFNIQITETLSGPANSPNATTLPVTGCATDSDPIREAVLDLTQGAPRLAA